MKRRTKRDVIRMLRLEMDGERRPAIPPNKVHRDAKHDYRRHPKHKFRDEMFA